MSVAAPFKIASIAALVLLLGLAPPLQSREREPFFAPPPPLELYDFAAAAERVKLRGLLLTGDQQRAVVYLTGQRRFQVLEPRSQLTIILDELRHTFTVEQMGQRRLVLRGEDRQLYSIGVEQSE